jgi:hypothetical protein
MNFLDACFKEQVELAEFTMANWQVICSMAMSKWRPYAIKTAAAVALEEIVAMARGKALLQSPGGRRGETGILGPVDALDEDVFAEVSQDLLGRLKRRFVHESVAVKTFEELCEDAARFQKHRDLLLHLQTHFALVKRSEKLLFMIACHFSDDFEEDQHIRHGFESRTKFLELAVMSPLHLLQLLVSFACSGATYTPHDFSQQLSQWMEAQSAEPVTQVSCWEDMLIATAECRDCGSRKTVYQQLKTRAADEVFSFRIVCKNCHASFSL